MRGAVGVHAEAHGASHTDGISHLHEHFVGNSGSHHVLGDVAGGIGSRAVNFRWVFSRESTTTVSAFSSVGINDDFASGEAGVAVWATNHEFSCGVHVENEAVVDHCLYLFGELGDYARQEYVAHVGVDAVEHLAVGIVLNCLRVVGRSDKLVVLGADYDGVNAHRVILFVVFHCHLALGVGAQVGHHLSLAANG